MVRGKSQNDLIKKMAYTLLIDELHSFGLGDDALNTLVHPKISLDGLHEALNIVARPPFDVVAIRRGLSQYV